MVEQKLSQQISGFLQLMEQAQKSYTYSAEEVQRMELLTQDYLHKLELQSCSYHARTRVATAIRDCRAERRRHKDNTIILEPLVGFLQAEKGKLLFHSSSKRWALCAKQSVSRKIDSITPESSAQRNTKKNFQRKQRRFHFKKFTCHLFFICWQARYIDKA